jgi:hypothetical protein
MTKSCSWDGKGDSHFRIPQIALHAENSKPLTLVFNLQMVVGEKRVNDNVREQGTGGDGDMVTCRTYHGVLGKRGREMVVDYKDLSSRSERRRCGRSLI